MNKIILLSLVAIVGGAASLSAAQTAGTIDATDPPAKPSRGEMRVKFKTEADLDKDGTVSEEERAAFHEKMKAAFFAKKDANSDGELSQEELDRMPEAVFAELDKDKSGGLSPAEMPARGPHGGRGHHRHGDFAKHFFSRMDGNGDGKVTKAEMREAADRHFDRLDANKDGSVTEDELKSHGQKRMEKAKEFGQRLSKHRAQLHASR